MPEDKNMIKTRTQILSSPTHWISFGINQKIIRFGTTLLKGIQISCHTFSFYKR